MGSQFPDKQAKQLLVFCLLLASIHTLSSKQVMRIFKLIRYNMLSRIEQKILVTNLQGNV